MEKITIKTKDGKEIDKFLFNTSAESCPLCDTPLSESYGSWAMFHGEINRNCCNSPWQTKDFSPPDGEKESYQPFFDRLNEPHIQQLKVPQKLWQPIRDAFEKFGVKDLRNDDVYNEIKPLI